MFSNIKWYLVCPTSNKVQSSRSWSSVEYCKGWSWLYCCCFWPWHSWTCSKFLLLGHSHKPELVNRIWLLSFSFRLLRVQKLLVLLELLALTLTIKSLTLVWFIYPCNSVHRPSILLLRWFLFISWWNGQIQFPLFPMYLKCPFSCASCGTC
jgi:hypothetical protein